MQTYSLKTVAARYHLAPSTLRYYEDIGLLRHVPRRSNHRYYTDQHLGRLDAITCFKQTGMTLEEIQTFFHYEDSGEDLDAILALLQHHASSLAAQIHALQLNQAHIQRKLCFYQDIAAAHAKGLPDPDWDDYPLSRFFAPTTTETTQIS
ncbi:MerR family transcriptional regulator [Lacticaseibacillus baoqingensis]|uniref:MerR family transcriptional regulator n=1 Tax=Lacticaseibacillus baoqingensis TaxID=2486013 RepID=A0ABW4EBF5_9LACO|nr:MerR family transcriptional regulator [Lacticaseibacillus baoqingensis]